MKTITRLAIALAGCLLTFAASARAGERFLDVPFEALVLEGEPPPAPDEPAMPWMLGMRPWWEFEPYVVLDQPGEAWVDAGGALWTETTVPARLLLRVEHEGAIRGRLFAPIGLGCHFEGRRFEIAARPDDPAARAAFYAAMEQHYEMLLREERPGAAWFRHRAHHARAQRALEPASDTQRAIHWARRVGLDDSYDLFTGERALAENLDLERALRGLRDEPATLDVATIEGVSTRAMDWKALVADLKPALDPLASLIPADQHGVFFPSFEAMTAVFDELDASGTPVIHFADARAEDQRTKERYQEQLCLPLSGLARLLGPTVVASVALTGSDPFLPSGSDLALLFECKQADVLASYLALRHAEAQTKGAAPAAGKLGALAWSGVRSADRRISSYMARLGDTLVVTNSLVQLERIDAARAGNAPQLARTDEYIWFRERYKRGDAGESALVVLSDATIRRWASPRARIGNSRRVRAAAAMAEIQARHLDALAAGTLTEGASAADPALPFSADFTWTRRGVFSPTFGSLAFLTPLAELEVHTVSASEKQAYENFRRGFQDLWSTVFDPIALRLSVADAKLGADLTVMPLAATTTYREMIDWTRGAQLGAASGDPHASTLLHLAFAFGATSELARMVSSNVGPLARELGADPLGWIGDGVALYAERDPFWDELAQAGRDFEFVDEHWGRLPLVLHVEVDDALKLAGFLTGLRAMADGAAPGLTRWETKTWKEQPYVAIRAEAAGNGSEAPMGLYYAALPDALIVSLREDLVQQALDRRSARKAGAAETAGSAGASPRAAWLGTSLGLSLERDAFDLLEGFASDELGARFRSAAWSALPILNEWKRRFPDEDPVALHERLWGVRLVSPDGGAYVWNEELQTMQAQAYGSPYAPRAGPRLPQAFERFTRGAFGLSFESLGGAEGLRVRGELERGAR